MKKKPYLSVIIPAYNEANRIGETLADINRVLREAPFTNEVIVVNDGSDDQTCEVVRKFNAHMPNLRLIDNSVNHGKGWVVRQGMLHGTGSWRLFMDADNSTTLDQFHQMVPHLKGGYDIVIGSRAVAGAQLAPRQPLYRQIPGKIGNLVIQALILPGIWDSQCGFKCFSEEAATKIFQLTRIDRWGFDVEALALAKLFGFRVKEIPIIWINNVWSKVGVLSYFSTLLELIKVSWWLRMGSYDRDLPAERAVRSRPRFYDGSVGE